MKAVKFTRDSGCLARNEFHVIFKHHVAEREDANSVVNNWPSKW